MVWVEAVASSATGSTRTPPEDVVGVEVTVGKTAAAELLEGGGDAEGNVVHLSAAERGRWRVRVAGDAVHRRRLAEGAEAGRPLKDPHETPSVAGRRGADDVGLRTRQAEVRRGSAC